jgi:NitT/TauT family transport system substrate-binding protein
MRRYLFAISWIILLCAPASAGDKVTLMLNWYVYSEHAPFYYGKAKGIYQGEGIDLDIQEGRGSAITTQAVAAKTAEFGYVDVPTMIRAAASTRTFASLRISREKPSPSHLEMLYRKSGRYS